MLNKVVLIGRLTKKVEQRKAGENMVSNFTLAVNRFTNDVDFINCVAWNKQSDVLYKYTNKGSTVAVSGRIQTRNYEGNDGKRVYITEVYAEQIVLLDSKKDTQIEIPKSASAPQNDGVNIAAYGEDYNNLEVRNEGFLDVGEPLDLTKTDLPF